LPRKRNSNFFSIAIEFADIIAVANVNNFSDFDSVADDNFFANFFTYKFSNGITYRFAYIDFFADSFTNLDNFSGNVSVAFSNENNVLTDFIAGCYFFTNSYADNDDKCSCTSAASNSASNAGSEDDYIRQS
jgi:hypothetical protein